MEETQLPALHGERNGGYRKELKMIKTANFTDQTEQERLKTWQHGLEETPEVNVQEFIGHDKPQREEGHTGEEKEEPPRVS